MMGDVGLFISPCHPKQRPVHHLPAEIGRRPRVQEEDRAQVPGSMILACLDLMECRCDLQSCVAMAARDDLDCVLPSAAVRPDKTPAVQ